MSKMGAHLHSHKLLALAVFVDSLKTAYVRSVRLHEESIGSLHATQQDFLFDPGKYKIVTEPVILESLRMPLSGVDVKQTLGTIIAMHKSEGWLCMLEFRSDSPSETAMLCVLTPSKNPHLKDVPQLELDLKVIERVIANGWSLGQDGESSIVTLNENTFWPSTDLSLSYSLDMSLLEHSKDISGSVTTERILGQQFDICKNWRSELELATPKASLRRAFSSDQGSLSNPTMMLDLNLDLREFSAGEDNDPDCSLLLTPAVNPKPLLNLDLETPSLSLQHSSATDESTDFSALESFPDSPSSYKVVRDFPGNRLVNLKAIQTSRPLCSEDSDGCHGSANGNSSTTGSGLFSAYDENLYGSMDHKLLGSPSTGYYKYTAKGHGKQGSTRAGSTGMHTMQHWGCNVDAIKSKPRIARPGTTSERITAITLHELSQYFSMPINEAAKKLNVGLTVLKKKCREFKIPRWPHRKMKSINCLIGNIKDLAQDQGAKSSSCVLNVVRELEEQRKVMEEMPGAELAERTKKLRQACFKANYKKRRLGMVSNNNLYWVRIYAPGELSLSVSRGFGISDLTPTSTLPKLSYNGTFPLTSPHQMLSKSTQ